MFQLSIGGRNDIYGHTNGHKKSMNIIYIIHFYLVYGQLAMTWHDMTLPNPTFFVVPTIKPSCYNLQKLLSVLT